MAYNKRSYTDAEKAAYWRQRAQQGAGNARQKQYAQSAEQFKKSGASFNRINKPGAKYQGSYMVSAWKKNKSGLIRANASPIGDERTSGSGKTYQPYLVSITHMNTLQTTKYNGIMNTQTRVLVIQDLGMCITPNGSGKTKSGTVAKGYFGKFSK